jgi:hypothetical protein
VAAPIHACHHCMLPAAFMDAAGHTQGRRLPARRLSTIAACSTLTAGALQSRCTPGNQSFVVVLVSSAQAARSSSSSSSSQPAAQAPACALT